MGYLQDGAGESITPYLLFLIWLAVSCLDVSIILSDLPLLIKLMFLAIITIFYLSYCWWFWKRYFNTALRLMKFRPINSPNQIEGVSLSKSQANVSASKKNLSEGKITFLTEKLSVFPIDKLSNVAAVPFVSKKLSEGEHIEKDFYEIHLFYSLHNWSEHEFKCYDMHVQVYHSTTGGQTMLEIGSYTPPERFRIDLCADNSILSNGKVYEVAHSKACYFELVFEFGFYDFRNIPGVQIIFGIDVDIEVVNDGHVKKYCVPSDCLYLIGYYSPRDSDEDGIYPEFLGSIDRDGNGSSPAACLSLIEYFPKGFGESGIFCEILDSKTITLGIKAKAGDRRFFFKKVKKIYKFHNGRGIHEI
jgi:hypothetical protein